MFASAFCHSSIARYVVADDWCAFGWLAHSRNSRLRLFTEGTHLTRIDRDLSASFIISRSRQFAESSQYGDLLGVDLVGNPDLAAQPEYAFQTAGLFWKMRGLNELADIQVFTTITKRINGGLTGLAERQRYYETAKKALGLVP